MSLLAEGLRHWFSESDLKRLRAATVGIAGVGGLGSNVAMLLVRSGIRRFVLVDGDHVEPSNLNRQCFWPEDVGLPKVLALHDRLKALEPDLDCRTHKEWIREESACALFSGCDVVVEALDNAAFKAEFCSTLLTGGFFVVAASGLAGFGQPPMQVRRLGKHFICVGDFVSDSSKDAPLLAPRVAQAAALQADAVLAHILRPVENEENADL